MSADARDPIRRSPQRRAPQGTRPRHARPHPDHVRRRIHGWVGTAAKLGDAHVVFWLSAIVLFYLRKRRVVVYLNGLMPLEGGLYQWAASGSGGSSDS
jgi:hypothetical protein